MGNLLAAIGKAWAFFLPFLTLENLFRVVIGLLLTLLLKYIAGRIKNLVWRLTNPLTQVQRQCVERFLDIQTHNAQLMGGSRFDPNKDYVDNSKRLLDENIARQYIKTHWLWFRKTYGLSGLVKMIAHRSKTGPVFALVGEPACGKTFEILKITCELTRHWKPGRPLPILIFMNSLPRTTIEKLTSERACGIQQLVLDYLSDYPGKLCVPPDFITLLREQWVRLYPVVLCDALDEFPEKRKYEEVFNALARAGDELRGKGAVVLSCREGDYSKRSRFVPFRILPLTQKQIIKHYKRRGIRHERLVERGLEHPYATIYLSHYLDNVYFLTLYLGWIQQRLDEGAKKQAAGINIERLFGAMFEWELDKVRGRYHDEKAARYVQDAIAPIAYVLTVKMFSQVSAQNTAIYDPAILERLTGVPPDGQTLTGWRRALWLYVEHDDQPSAVSLGSEVQADEAFVEFLKAKPFHLDLGVQDHSTAVVDWGRRFCPQLVQPASQKLQEGIATQLSHRESPNALRFAAFQVVLVFRALGWAAAEDTGLLRADFQTGCVIGFRHQRIREYLTARYIEDGRHHDFLEHANIHNSWWRQTINMLFAITAAPDELICSILRDAQGSYDGLLLVAESFRFLPIEAREKCSAQVEGVFHSLSNLAFQEKVKDTVDQVDAVGQIGRLVAAGVIPSTGELIRGFARLVRRESTKREAINALPAIMRADKHSLRTCLIGLSSILFGLMFHDPEEPYRPFGKKASLQIRVLLWLLEHIGWVVRGVPPALWILLLLAWTVTFVTDPRLVMNLWPFFPTLVVLMLWAVLSVWITGSWAYTLYAMLVLPLIGMANLSVWLGSVVWTMIAAVWAAGGYVFLLLGTLRNCIKAGMHRFPVVVKSITNGVISLLVLCSRGFFGFVRILVRLPCLVIAFSWKIPALIIRCFSRAIDWLAGEFRPPESPPVEPQRIDDKPPAAPSWDWGLTFGAVLGDIRSLIVNLFFLASRIVLFPVIVAKWWIKEWKAVTVALCTLVLGYLIFFTVLPFVSRMVSRYHVLEEYKSFEKGINAQIAACDETKRATARIYNSLEMVAGRVLKQTSESPEALLQTLTSEDLASIGTVLQSVIVKGDLMHDGDVAVLATLADLEGSIERLTTDSPARIAELRNLTQRYHGFREEVKSSVEKTRAELDDLVKMRDWVRGHIELRERAKALVVDLNTVNNAFSAGGNINLDESARFGDRLSRLENAYQKLKQDTVESERVRQTVFSDTMRPQTVAWVGHLQDLETHASLLLRELRSTLRQEAEKVSELAAAVRPRNDKVSKDSANFGGRQQVVARSAEAQRILDSLVQFRTDVWPGLRNKADALSDDLTTLCASFGEIQSGLDKEKMLSFLLDLALYRRHLASARDTLAALQDEVSSFTRGISSSAGAYEDLAVRHEVDSYEKQLGPIQALLDRTESTFNGMIPKVSRSVQEMVGTELYNWEEYLRNTRRDARLAIDLKGNCESLRRKSNDLCDSVWSLELGVIRSWYGAGGGKDLDENLDTLRRNYADLQRQHERIRTLTPAAKSLPDLAHRRAAQCRAIAKDTGLMQLEQLAARMEVSEALKDAAVLFRDYDETLKAIDSIEQDVESLLKRSESRLRTVWWQSFAIVLLDVCVGILLMGMVYFILHSWLKQRGIRRYRVSFSEEPNQKRRTVLLGAVKDELLMAVRKFALQELRDLALETQDDLKELVRVSEELETRSGRGDGTCAGALIDIAKGIRDRIHRSRTPMR
jgi:hypothetical protein